MSQVRIIAARWSQGMLNNPGLAMERQDGQKQSTKSTQISNEKLPRLLRKAKQKAELITGVLLRI
jgi:hypothetical protein